MHPGRARLWFTLLVAVTVSGCGTSPEAPPPTSISATSVAWSAGVLEIVMPLVERRLAAKGRGRLQADHPLLPLGLDALGRASGDPRYSSAAARAEVAGAETVLVAMPSVCAGSGCRTDDLLLASDLWAGPWAGEPGRARLAWLDPAFRRMALTLFDREALLFHADEDAIGERHFDATINATAFAALTRMVDALPAEDPARLEYVALYREMARTVTRTQGPDALWHARLEDGSGPADMKASALFVFGLTWGLNTGMLSFNEGESAALNGWEALRTPARLATFENDDAALGALLLASAQMAERRW